MTSQRKSRKRKSHQNLPHIPYHNCHNAKNIKTRKGAAKQRIFLCPNATNTEHSITHNTKTKKFRNYKNYKNNTGINIVRIIKPLDILSIRPYYRSKSNEFKAGNIKHCFHELKECWV